MRAVVIRIPQLKLRPVISGFDLFCLLANINIAGGFGAASQERTREENEAKFFHTNIKPFNALFSNNLIARNDFPAIG
jgi:hypothetical protein